MQQQEKIGNLVIAIASMVVGFALLYFFDNGIQWFGLIPLIFGLQIAVNQFDEMSYNMTILTYVLTFGGTGIGVLGTGAGWIVWLSAIPFALSLFFLIGLIYGEENNNVEEEKSLKSAAGIQNKVCDTMSTEEESAETISKQALVFEEKGIYKKALELYEKAAKMGCPEALFKVGFFYDLGMGCKRDEEKALMYVEKAVQSGHEIAKEHLKRMRECA